MTRNTKYELVYDDYAQSANALFHFMKKSKYLEEVLQKKALIPRYCKENIQYLDIKNEGISFDEVAILQKCFCDIPLHNLMENFCLTGEGENYQKLSDEEKDFCLKNNTHPDFYGKYAIAFSKKWGEKKNLQPVHYINEQSQYTRDFLELVNKILQEEDVPELYVNDVLERLSFIKPLRGLMKRKNEEDQEVVFHKNFYDEQEWRYVPSKEVLSAAEIEAVIANSNTLKMSQSINECLVDESYSSLWLKYDYDDIRYIIVPDINARIDIIRTIMSLSSDKFDDYSDTLIQKYVLISKILVLDEIRKDW